MTALLQKKNRLEVFDLLRGFFIFGIIVNHLALFPNLLAVFTGATKLWVSFAEGFFIVSGFFIGYLYKNKIKENFWLTTRKITTRSFKLYLWTVGLTFLFVYWGNLMPKGLVKTGLWIVSWQNLPELVLKGITLQYNYGWANILPFYSVLIFFSPLILWLLSLDLLPILVFMSLFFWVYRGQSFYFAIQPLYFFGLVTGFYFEKIKSLWFGYSEVTRYKLKTILYVCFLLSLFASVFFVSFFGYLARYLPMSDFLIAKVRVLNWYFDKNTLGLGRLILAPVWFWAGTLFFFDKVDLIKKYFGLFLVPFGKYSLYAYILHAIIIFPIPFLISKLKISGFWWNTLVSLFVVWLVYAILALGQKYLKKKNLDLIFFMIYGFLGHLGGCFFGFGNGKKAASVTKDGVGNLGNQGEVCVT